MESKRQKFAVLVDGQTIETAAYVNEPRAYQIEKLALAAGKTPQIVPVPAELVNARLAKVML